MEVAGISDMVVFDKDLSSQVPGLCLFHFCFMPGSSPYSVGQGKLFNTGL